MYIVHYSNGNITLSHFNNGQVVSRSDYHLNYGPIDEWTDPPDMNIGLAVIQIPTVHFYFTA